MPLNYNNPNQNSLLLPVFLFFFFVCYPLTLPFLISSTGPPMPRKRPGPELKRMAEIKRPKTDPSETREGLFRLANLALAGKRYEHMFHYMKTLVRMVAPVRALSNDERRCFSLACTSLVNGQRDSFHYVKAAKDSAGGDQRRVNAAIEYQHRIAIEIIRTCSNVIEIMDLCFFPLTRKWPPPSVPSREARVFYRIMKAEFQTYMAQVMAGVHTDSVRHRTYAYLDYLYAQDDAEHLKATDLTRLELNHSFAQFLAEVYEEPQRGYDLAKQAFDMAMHLIETLKEPVSAETTAALGRLQNFLDCWKLYERA